MAYFGVLCERFINSSSDLILMAKRIAVVEREKCFPERCGNYWCVGACPVNRGGAECIAKAPDGKIKIDEVLCTGCGICVKCPFDAIHIINLPSALDTQPIHQYGENGFRLFSLPMPIFGKVVGVLGRNGIGKSTAIQILAGVLEPNLGDLEKKKVDYKELISYFKGTETQKFFEGLSKGKIKAAYKPQQVDLIPKTQKGKVGALLKKVDEKKIFDSVVEALDLKEVLDTPVDKISGGELQRVAIAATAMKDAQVYFFDEPSSFLDIKQRLNVSKFIRGLANEDTAVVVIEHDLIILDYMTDLVQIMYGEEGAYGIVSQPKATRSAINVYLGGYLKEENVRFRSKSIKFSNRPAIKKKRDKSIVKWGALDTSLGRFSLKAEKGIIYSEDVVGILGENGIGKTSFVRILAKDLKVKKGEITENIKVSYKPQYLETGSDELVMGFLGTHVQKFEAQLMRPLKIKPLLMKKMSELSGGELQRVAIAHCLAQDVELFLLDEPSAYLDVEQRLIVSKAIRDFMEQTGKSCLVVDHDLLFVDYLSDDLMVFDGKPAKEGVAKGPYTMQEGMNLFLSRLNISLRRDNESKRPRINKEGSVKDREQKSKKQLYYG